MRRILAVLEDILASTAHARKTVLPFSLLHSLLLFGEQFVASSADALEANSRNAGADISNVHQRRLALRATAVRAIGASGSFLSVEQTSNGSAALGAHALAAEIFFVVLVYAFGGSEGSGAAHAHAVITIFLARGLQHFLASTADAVHAEFSGIFQDIASAVNEGLGAVGAHAALAEGFVSALDNVGIILGENSSALRAHASVAERGLVLDNELHGVEGIGAAAAHAVGAVSVRHLPARMGVLAPHTQTPLVEVLVALLHG